MDAGKACVSNPQPPKTGCSDHHNEQKEQCDHASKNALISISITQSFLKHRSRHTATASRAERPGRYPKESSWNTFSSSGSSASTATVCATLSTTLGMPRILVPPFFGISTARTGPGKYDPDDMRFHSLYRLPRKSASNRSIVMPSAPAAPLFSFTFSHASHTSRFGISCVLPCNIGSVMWFIPSGWPHSSTRATQPLGSTRITRFHSYYGPVRQRAPRPVLSPSRFLPLGVLPFAATPGGRFEATPPHVPYESLVRAHAACTPDTTWAVSRYPPGSSQGNYPTLVSMSTELISTRLRQIFPTIFPDHT